MKKILALLMVGIMMFSLTACFSSFEGEWKAVEVDAGDNELSKELQDLYLSYELTLEKDGVGEIGAAGVSIDVEWEEDGDKLIITGDKVKGEITGEINDDDQLVIEDEGVIIYFEKE